MTLTRRGATVDPANAWWQAMRRGDYDAAWRVADDVLATRSGRTPAWTVPRHEQWVWDGRDLTARHVLVRCYHGLGDTIQFARFLPRLERMARHTTVWAQPSLLPLLRSLPFRGTLLPLHDGTVDCDYEVDIEIMELGHALRVSLSDVAQAVPYLDVRPAPRLAPGFCVGVVAQSGNWDARRSISGELLAGGLADLEGITLVSLQLGSPVPGMLDASTPDILTLAARLKALDLVITVDTMMAHLAGGLGVRTWTLLPYDADWRWLTERSDSPWYPGMRLYRQSRRGTWTSVVQEVRQALACAR